jgi:ornithine carbamoyltransferase
MKDLLMTTELTSDDFLYLLDLASEVKTNPHKYSKELTNETIALYFTKPSTRTRISFETAITRLGATPIMLNSTDLQLGRGETIEDTAKTISKYCKAFIIRTFADEDIKKFASASTISVINALTDNHHPCQSLADMLTLRENFGNLVGLKVGYIGDGNNVAHSLMEAAALTGVNITIATPKGYEPNEQIVKNAREVAKNIGAQIILTNDINKAADDADAIYTDVWISMGSTIETENNNKIDDFKLFQVNKTLMTKAKTKAIFMHCLPCHRGKEVSAEIIDGPQSVVFDQAENRLHTAIAVLYALINGKLKGRNKP